MAEVKEIKISFEHNSRPGELERFIIKCFRQTGDHLRDDPPGVYGQHYQSKMAVLAVLKSHPQAKVVAEKAVLTELHDASQPVAKNRFERLRGPANMPVSGV